MPCRQPAQPLRAPGADEACHAGDALAGWHDAARAGGALATGSAVCDRPAGRRGRDAAGWARTEVDPGLQVPAAKPATLAVQPEKKNNKKQKAATHVTWVSVNLRILYGGIAIAADLALSRVSALMAEGMKTKRIKYNPTQRSSAITKTSGLARERCERQLHVAPDAATDAWRLHDSAQVCDRAFKASTSDTFR